MIGSPILRRRSNVQKCFFIGDFCGRLGQVYSSAFKSLEVSLSKHHLKAGQASLCVPGSGESPRNLSLHPHEDDSDPMYCNLRPNKGRFPGKPLATLLWEIECLFFRAGG